MSRPRYVVQTVSGYPFNMPMRSGSASGITNGGISAHVCDSLYLYEVVASYRSERKRDGQAWVVQRAEEHAERLNRGTA